MFNKIVLGLLFSAISFAGNPIIQTRTLYADTPVSISAWSQIVSYLPISATSVEVFDSSGQTLEIGIGSLGNERRLFIIFPGGNGFVPLPIPQGSRVSIRAISANATSGEQDVNFYN